MFDVFVGEEELALLIPLGSSGFLWTTTNGRSIRKTNRTGLGVINQAQGNIQSPLWAVVGDTVYMGDDRGGITTTKDFETFTPLTLNWPSGQVPSDILALFHDGTYLFACGAYNGNDNIALWRSSDLGVSWTLVVSVGFGPFFYPLDMVEGFYGYCVPVTAWSGGGQYDYLLFSKNNPTAFTQVTGKGTNVSGKGCYDDISDLFLFPNSGSSVRFEEASNPTPVYQTLDSVDYCTIIQKDKVAQIYVAVGIASGIPRTLKIDYISGGIGGSWQAATLPTIAAASTHTLSYSVAPLKRGGFILYYCDSSQTVKGFLYSKDGQTWVSATVTDLTELGYNSSLYANPLD
jgi:hypothetical protein